MIDKYLLGLAQARLCSQKILQENELRKQNFNNG